MLMLSQRPHIDHVVVIGASGPLLLARPQKLVEAAQGVPRPAALFHRAPPCAVRHVGAGAARARLGCARREELALELRRAAAARDCVGPARAQRVARLARVVCARAHKVAHERRAGRDRRVHQQRPVQRRHQRDDPRRRADGRECARRARGAQVAPKGDDGGEVARGEQAGLHELRGLGAREGHRLLREERARLPAHRRAHELPLRSLKRPLLLRRRRCPGRSSQPCGRGARDEVGEGVHDARAAPPIGDHLGHAAEAHERRQHPALVDPAVAQLHAVRRAVAERLARRVEVWRQLLCCEHAAVLADERGDEAPAPLVDRRVRVAVAEHQRVARLEEIERRLVAPPRPARIAPVAVVEVRPRARVVPNVERRGEGVGV
mmetsp:Transcript_10700/g.27816  ORF Transcript_10700/g.27816 Transcript_10700/m.27816 type:complete len:378 (-) Transcript_10700:181-1314(-)